MLFLNSAPQNFTRLSITFKKIFADISILHKRKPLKINDTKFGKLSLDLTRLNRLSHEEGFSIKQGLKNAF